MTEALLAEIRAEMARQRVLIGDLAARLPISAAGLGRRLSGTTPLSFADAEAIADALGVSLATLVERATLEAAAR